MDFIYKTLYPTLEIFLSRIEKELQNKNIFYKNYTFTSNHLYDNINYNDLEAGLLYFGNNNHNNIQTNLLYLQKNYNDICI